MGLIDDDELIREVAQERHAECRVPHPELVTAALARKVLDLEGRLDAEADARWVERHGDERS